MEKPAKPETDQRNQGSIIPLMLAIIVGASLLAALSLLTLGFFGMVVAVVLGLAAFIGLQYLIWGWWLADAIRDDVEAEDQDQA